MPKRCNATGGASTAAASSAVSIPLPHPAKTSPGIVTTARCWSTGDVPGSAGTCDAQGMAAARGGFVHHIGLDFCFTTCFLGLVVSKGKLVSWRGIILPVQCGRQGMSLPKQSTSCFSIRTPLPNPSPQESKGSLGWKPGLKCCSSRGGSPVAKPRLHWSELSWTSHSGPRAGRS